MLWKSTYTLPASPEEIYNFFRNVEGIEKVWPAEMKMKLVKAEKDIYTVRFTYLGQRYTTSFRVTEIPVYKQFHEALDFPFGSLKHTISIEKIDNASKVVEEISLRSNNPFVGHFFKKILKYREQAIKHRFNVAERPVFNDPLRISLSAGNLVSLACIATAYWLLFFVTSLPFTGGRFLVGLISFTLLWFFTHDLAHYIVGRVIGIRFSHYYLGLSNIVRLNIFPKPLKTLPVVLGIKIDRKNSRASPFGYAAMYSAGPLASMLTPLTVPIIILYNNPASLAGQLLLIIAAANVFFTSLFSPKAGCFAKALKALKFPTTF